MMTFSLRSGYKVHAFPSSDRSVTFDTYNEKGELVSVVTHQRSEANRLLSSLAMISTGRVVHGAA